MASNISVQELTTYEAIEQVVLAFSDSHFLRTITHGESRKQFIEKHLEYGHVVAEFHDETPVGFISFYSNDLINKIAYVTAFAISEDLGFLKGKTLMRLLSEGKKIVDEKGMKAVRLEVEKENTKAIRLYKHFGFNKISGTDNGLTHLSDNTIFMELNLENFKL